MIEDEKKLVRYTARGIPVYEDRDGDRICCLEGCYSKSHDSVLCPKHYTDGKDYSGFINTVKKPLNIYTLIDDSYYEMRVNNSDVVYKLDIEDFSIARRHNWRASSNKNYPYLVSKFTMNSKVQHIRLHIEIMKNSLVEYKDSEYSKQIIIDHINGDVTDNRKINLRVRTQSENNMNKTIQKNNTSGIVGVSWNRKLELWSSDISVDGKRIVLGKYYYLRNAVKARLNAERLYFGEHAFKERSVEYSEYLEELLSMEDIREPIIKPRPSKYPYISGIKTRKNKDSYRYVSTVYYEVDKTRKNKSKTFDTLQETLRWKKEKEIEILGVEVLHQDEKKFQTV